MSNCNQSATFKRAAPAAGGSVMVMVQRGGGRRNSAKFFIFTHCVRAHANGGSFQQSERFFIATPQTTHLTLPRRNASVMSNNKQSGVYSELPLCLYGRQAPFPPQGGWKSNHSVLSLSVHLNLIFYPLDAHIFHTFPYIYIYIIYIWFICKTKINKSSVQHG